MSNSPTGAERAVHAALAPRIRDALAHLDASPGKRLRPQLVQAAAEACGGGHYESAAEAVEFIHTYSLIHDDLPAMDNDDMRRGQPTLHIAFDEATAILVGDGLQARAFELLANDDTLSAEQRVALISCLAAAAGFAGMVGGQSLDMTATERALSLEDLQEMHAGKTGALIVASLEMGAIVAGASEQQRATLREIGSKSGLAFQIVDDVIDVISSSETLGKTSGKDAAAGKATYVSLLGLDEAKARAESLLEDSLNQIADWGPQAEALRSLLVRLVRRSS
ncbi:MAG: polyprenyl synthetase family protein [Pseudomonadota bacterium]